jgi:poly(A) polymerase
MTALPSLADTDWLKAPGLQCVFRAIASAGGEARVAGGAVRNALLGEAVADIDVATTLKPDEIMAAGKAAGLGVHPTGIDHGTVTLTHHGVPYEVTTLRVDTETFGRRARVAFTSDWESDARRRDFTMNALYCDDQGKIYDFVDGYTDILNRRVRFIDDPAARIREDYLRILRFFRFHARYGGGSPDREGLRACIRFRRGLDHLSRERIRAELFKLLVAPGAVKTLSIMAAKGILRHIIPHTDQFAALAHMARVDAVNGLVPDALCRLALLAQYPDELKEGLKLSNEENRRLAQMTKEIVVSPALRPNERRAMLYALGVQDWTDAVRLSWARSRARAGNGEWQALLQLPGQWPIPRFPVQGGDLLRRGIPAGPALGERLRQIEDWWIATDFRADKDELLARFVPREGQIS